MKLEKRELEMIKLMISKRIENIENELNNYIEDEELSLTSSIVHEEKMFLKELEEKMCNWTDK